MLHRHVRFFQFLSQIYHVLEKETVICEIDLALRHTDLSSQFDKERKHEQSLKDVYSVHIFTLVITLFLQQSSQNLSKDIKIF